MLQLKSGLKITRAADPIVVTQLVVAIHGDPGIGKTSFAFTSEAPLCLAFDAGVYRAGQRRGDCVEIKDWSDVSNLTRSDFEGYKTVIVDTGGRALDCLSADLIAVDARNGARSGGLSLPGYGALKSAFSGWLSNLRYIGLDVVLVCHSDEQRRGEDLITRLDMQGASKNEVYKSADLMGAMYTERGKVMLNFSPTDVSFGKNPAQLPPVQVPRFAEFGKCHTLAELIAQTKRSLNELGGAHAQAADLMTTWKDKIDQASSMGDFDALTTEGKALPAGADRDNIGRLIAQAAKGKGFTINRETGKFDMTPPPKARK